MSHFSEISDGDRLTLFCDLETCDGVYICLLSRNNLQFSHEKNNNAAIDVLLIIFNSVPILLWLGRGCCKLDLMQTVSQAWSEEPSYSHSQSEEQSCPYFFFTLPIFSHCM